MGVLKAGLCPGLTLDMVQLLRTHGIKTVVDLVSADLEEVAQKCGLSYKAAALQRIQVVRAFDIFQMLHVLQDLRGTGSQQVISSGTLKMVLVDSVTAVVSPLLGVQQGEGLAFMMQLARELKTVARDLGVAVVVTNHVTRDRDSGKLKPALGRSWSFVPSTRILLDMQEGAGTSGSQRVACLTKSPRRPTGIRELVDIGIWGTPEQSPVLEGDQT
ncbi:PREDICTED: DNA repair protein RAD51 homolog 4 isoform X2 [Chrysochloris asiatica]|uniref:DNA repair protein RAD51 homolog 4 isoform X2 n=1 Tax=Chrysochloris asiatica TaxID=185453 RepID=A0A9B0WFM3_CHRAS|nr:PREDICTED: DNA repair protein RAD51 homolog 4 isoform X2 [Chrysochloris asiatica]